MGIKLDDMSFDSSIQRHDELAKDKGEKTMDIKLDDMLFHSFLQRHDELTEDNRDYNICLTIRKEPKISRQNSVVKIMMGIMN